LEYHVGDKVVYPHHGAGTITKKEQREVLGENREYLTIRILHNDMTVLVPVDSADKAGLRKVITSKDVDEVMAVLAQDETRMPKNWNRRFKYNREKIKTGDIFELAEVVRNLAIRESQKGLSTGEKQMFNRAKKILSSELMYAQGLDEKEADKFLDLALKDAKPVGAGKMDDS
jgi:CarD family transcriptional regulator